MECINTIIGGDFNCYFSSSLRSPSYCKDQSRTGRALQNVLKIFNLLDGWRYMNPHNKNYIFHCPPHLSLSRIDYIWTPRPCSGTVWHWTHCPFIPCACHSGNAVIALLKNASLFHDDNFGKFLETQTDFCLIVS